MATVTTLDVANMALALLLEAPIDNLDDDDKVARLVNLHFDTVVESELTKYAWSWARKISDEITASDSGLADQYQYAYELPDDFLRALWVTRDGRPDGAPVTYTAWADGLRSDYEGPLVIGYVAAFMDPADWTALFTDVVAAQLAIRLAYPITAKQSMIEVAQNAYDRAVAEALRVDAALRSGTIPYNSWAVQRGDWRNERA
jgi:hypothetical protein